jgi:CDP-diacylglycerol--glycerol-3-phosphate 3-phosphatidyltransferase
MVAVSIISAVDYFVAFWSTIDQSSATTRRSVILSRQRNSEIDVSAGHK